MQKGIYDLAVDELLRTYKLFKEEIRKEFKGKKPFRKELVPARERLVQFEMMPEEKKQFARENFPQEYTQYEAEMLKLKEKYNA